MSDHPSEQPSSTGAERSVRPKRPWLPRKHLIGLGAVAVFIVGSLSWTGIALARGWDPEQFQAARDLLEQQAESNVDEGHIFDRMSQAMLDGDREAFVSFGEGDARDQLAKIWDGTKAIGWTVGSAEQTYNGLYPSEDDVREPLPEGEDLFTYPDPVGVDFAFDLGFTATQADTVYPDLSEEEYDEALANDDPALEGEVKNFIMTQQFRYAITVTGDYTGDTMRITSLEPLAAQPWDHPDGVAVEKRDNAVIYGFAADRAAVEAAADDVQTAALAVLEDQGGMFPRVSHPGFPVFLTTDNERFRTAAYGGVPGALESQTGTEAGLAKTFQGANLNWHTRDEAQLYDGLGVSGVLLMLNQSTDDPVLRTSVHEMTHALHNTGQDGSWSNFVGEGSAERMVGVEGYATAVEDKLVAPIDGLNKTMAPDIRSAINEASDPGQLVSAEAFANPETVHRAYAVAGNYMTFLATSDIDTFANEIVNGNYEMMPFVLWAEGLRSTNGAELGIMAWKQWNVEGL